MERAGLEPATCCLQRIDGELSRFVASCRELFAVVSFRLFVKGIRDAWRQVATSGDAWRRLNGGSCPRIAPADPGRPGGQVAAGDDDDGASFTPEQARAPIAFGRLKRVRAVLS